jgi:hypothetical protein
MKNILLVQPIFLPDMARLNRNVNSLLSLNSYIEKNGLSEVNLGINIGGWAKTDQLWNEFVIQIRHLFNGNLNPIRLDKNYGKAYTINKLISDFNNEYDYQYILSLDSDIIFIEEEKYFFLRLIQMAENITNLKQKPFGFISLNQQGHGCHYKTVYENSHKYTIQINNDIIKEHAVWPNDPSGIAGGCLFISKQLWDKVGGYRIMGVYAGDDAYFLLDTHLNNFTYQMSDSISIIHPHENDEQYAKWKVLVCQRDSGAIKSNIDNQIKEAESFWNNR